MPDRPLLQRKFIFEAAHEKGFQKLRNHQFPVAEHGLLVEPLANAIDQNTPDKPVQVSLHKSGEAYCLSFQDDGPGLTTENLEALHFIGKSTKRDNKQGYIGRFGMGIAGTFNTHLGVFRTEIKTKVCNRPSRIIYDCSGSTMPSWWCEDIQKSCKGMTITFFLDPSKIENLRISLKRLLHKMIRPVRYNGQLYHRRPEQAPFPNAISIRNGTEPQSFYHAQAAQHVDDLFFSKDGISIYLRGMPVEEGAMYHVLIREAGDKMPQNYHGLPYMKHEDCIVLSNRAEPTLGRDKVIRNQDFEAIQKNVQQCRAQALVKLFDQSLENTAEQNLKHYARDMAMANVLSLRRHLETHLKQEAPESDTQYLEPLIESLLAYPLFSVFNQRERLSIQEIWNTKTPGGVLFYAQDENAASFLAGCHSCPFVLKEKRYVFSGLWGGHEILRLDTVLKPLIESQNHLEFVNLDKLIWDDQAIEALQERGIIQIEPLCCETAQDLKSDVIDFLKNLRDILNRPWFREALSRFRPPKQIFIRPIRVLNSLVQGELVAGVMKASSDPNDMIIGLNVDSTCITTLIHHPNGPFAFLPILCHELAHRRQTLSGISQDLPHGPGFFLNRLRLEDTVLQACVRYLLGEELDTPGSGSDQELIIL